MDSIAQNLEVVDVDMHNTKISEYRNEKCTPNTYCTYTKKISSPSSGFLF